MSFLLYPFAILAGALNAVQAGTNATLAKALGQPLAAAFVVTAGAVAVYLLASAVLGLSVPSREQVAAVPWWAWIGGLFGATYVLSTFYVAPTIGAAAYTGLTVAAAVVTSVALDHFGLVGFEVREAGLGRLAGAALMLAGVALVCLT